MQHIRGPEPEFGTTLSLSRSRSRSRSASISSDSQLSLIHLAPPSVNPPPSFIAPASASQIITSDQEFNAADFVADENDDSGALVTPEALSALNGFLDHLVLNILAAAKSTQLAAIRPAVADVLKPRLANLVVSVADEELSEYLGDEEDEQSEFRGGQSPEGEFDLIRTWKLTRLRCMVYTRLGDLEEDDEEEYIAQEGLVDEEGAPRRFTNHIGNITPAAAIFLTSIIEHIGEQALVIAGETARSRLSPKLVVECDENEDGVGKERGSMNRLVVEELDVEKLALNPTLGRLWRTWRKRTRTPNLSRLASRDSLRRRGTVAGTIGMNSRKSSFSITEDPLSPPLEEPQSESQSEAQVEAQPEAQPEIDPVSIPLPMGENDVEEIENEDFPDFDTAEIRTMQAVVAHKVRPQSLMVLTLQSPKSPSSHTGSPITPISARSAPPLSRHARSRSLPSPTCPSEAPEVDPAYPVPRRPSPAASEERRRLDTMYEHEEREEAETVKEDKGRKLAGLTTELKPEQTPPSNLPDDVADNVTKGVIASAAKVATSQAADTESPSIEPETEVIEGQGTVQKPSPVQRPKRNPSKDATRNSDRQATPASSSDVESLPKKQSEEVPIPVAPTEPSVSLPPTSAREVRPSLDSVRGSRPASNSSDSVHSSFSRAQRPSALNLTSGSQRSATSSVSSSVTERAAVQRIPARPSTSSASSPHPSIVPKSRRSGSFSSNREKRPMTAGSTTSQKLKGLINRSEEPNPRRDSEGMTRRFTLLSRQKVSEKWIKPTAQRPNTVESANGSVDTSRPMVSPRSQPSPKSRASEKPRPAPIQVPRANTPQKSKVIQARDARPVYESSSDLAQFIRNSGPASPPILNKSVSRQSSDAQLSRRSSRAESAMSGSTRGPRLQAKPPALPKSETNSTSDLIDFIREGPPTAGARRIPRTVAPFRSTMDSDDLAYEHGATPSITSTQGESTTTKSLASVGSHTRLIDSSNKASTNTRIGSTKPPSSSAGQIPVEDDPRPKRAQRRVPDPYALDWDDEELEAMLEEEEEKKNPKPKRDEESLIDFLRNVPPPPEPEQPQPIVAPRTKTPNGGSSSMKARLLRSASSEKGPTLKGPSTKSSQTSLRQQSDQYSKRPSNYTVKSSDAMYGLASVSERQTDTSALADFLRNTGPPSPAPPQGPSKDTSFARRFFVRRKKVEA
ncbi:uncharacterized protein ANIA_01940 [Aspergillus nidulans FGSC A4]|uniref:Uncharacterized protein n=1 Tax=Emericella nidulans (strain FGSC A4 / ATCC 38163 / CBS 112.46 / NRRL 194 / M139) TaxID=227321 RepID=C8VKW2_EMENI|nr:hypothetical protein [Aspergillus nidulans FGSC A4]CBF85863.1 TPA: conserved hypothetical protein [Aspergillus nidulans FGSC A4]